MQRMITIVCLCSLLAGCATYGKAVSTVTAPAAKAHADMVQKQQKKGK
jgi:hypothetical protein